MTNVRIIPCLDVTDGRVVKGTNFVDLKDAGDPVELASKYDHEGADEIVFLDITASSDRRETVFELVRRCAEEILFPLRSGVEFAVLTTLESFYAKEQKRFP